MSDSPTDIETMLRRVTRDESGPTPVALAGQKAHVEADPAVSAPAGTSERRLRPVG